MNSRQRLWINIFIVAWAIIAGVVVTLGPWHVVTKQRAQADKDTKEMTQAESNAIKLLQQEDRESSSIGREEASRKAGYIGPGEVASNTDKK